MADAAFSVPAPCETTKEITSLSTALPETSLNLTVIFEVSVPFANIAAGSPFMSIKDMPKKSTVVESESAPTLAVTVDVTDVALAIEVSVTQAVPLEVSAVGSMVPDVAEKEITVPSGTMPPSISVAIALMVVLDTPFA